MPWSASSGATMSASTSARPMANAASQARPGRLRSDDGLRWLLRDDVLEGRPREYSEDRVVQREEEQEPPSLGRHCGTHAADHEWNRQWEDQEGEQHFARATGDRHRGHERTDCADPDVGEKKAEERRRVERLEEHHERRDRD